MEAVLIMTYSLLRLADFRGAGRCPLAKTGALLRVAVPCFCFGRRRALAKDRLLPLLRLACFVRWTRLGCAASRAFAASSTGRTRRGCNEINDFNGFTVPPEKHETNGFNDFNGFTVPPEKHEINDFNEITIPRPPNGITKTTKCLFCGHFVFSLCMEKP